MAKKKEEEKKVVLERTYIVPLRKEWLKSPKWKRSKKAVKALKEFAAKHMKAETVKLGKYVNKELWKHGIKNPPHKVKVNCSKDDKGIVTVELVGAPVEKKEEKEKKATEKKEAKVETKKSEEEIKKAMTELEKKTEAVKKEKEVKTEEKPKEEKPAEKKEEPKEQPKAEATPKEVKKEEPKTPEKQ